MVRNSATVKGRVYSQFICSTYKKLGKDTCASHIIDEEALCEIIIATIQNRTMCTIDSEKLLEQMQRAVIKKREKQFYVDKIEYLETELNKIKLIKQGLYKDYKEGIITFTEYGEMKVSFENSYKKKEQEIYNQKENLKKLNVNEIFKNEYIENFKRYKNITELSREVIINLIEEIIVYKDKKVKILFRFEDEYKKLHPILDSNI
jgi:hypothetical protein